MTLQTNNSYQYDPQQELPGEAFSLIMEGNVLECIRTITVVFNDNESYSLKAYVGFEEDSRMHRLEEVFFSESDVMTVAHALLEYYVKRHNRSKDQEDQIQEMHDNLDALDKDTQKAVTIMFPE